MDLGETLLIFAFFYFIFLLLMLKKRNKTVAVYDPFKLWEMIVMLQCKKCGFKKSSTFQRGDYIYKTISDYRSKHNNCDGEVEIIGLYHVHTETPEEKRWKEYERKFR